MFYFVFMVSVRLWRYIPVAAEVARSREPIKNVANWEESQTQGQKKSETL